MTVLRDPFFGEMNDDYGWRKKQVFEIWGNNFELEVVASAFDEQEITPAQQDSYIWFTGQESTIFDKALDEIVHYAQQNIDDLLNIDDEISPDKIKGNLIKNLVTPTSVIFRRDDVIGILFNCAWEPEHGIAIKIKDKKVTEVGLQDIIL
jgi:hypothetical protein